MKWHWFIRKYETYTEYRTTGTRSETQANRIRWCNKFSDLKKNGVVSSNHSAQKGDTQIVSYTWCFASHKASCCLYTSGCLTRKQTNSSKYHDNKINLGLMLKSNLLLNKLHIIWKNKLPSHGNFHTRHLQSKLNTDITSEGFFFSHNPPVS